MPTVVLHCKDLNDTCQINLRDKTSVLSIAIKCSVDELALILELIVCFVTY